MVRPQKRDKRPPAKKLAYTKMLKYNIALPACQGSQNKK
jgi:hypothetical protein